jgi:hypothetical protein
MERGGTYTRYPHRSVIEQKNKKLINWSIKPANESYNMAKQAALAHVTVKQRRKNKALTYFPIFAILCIEDIPPPPPCNKNVMTSDQTKNLTTKWAL